MSLRSTLLLIVVLGGCAAKSSASSEPPPRAEPATSSSAASGPITVVVEPSSRETDPGFWPPLRARIEPDAPADTVTFGWKTPCSVPARSFKSRSGKGSAITRMNVVFEARDDGDVVRLEDLEFERLNGEVIDTEEERAPVESTLTMVRTAMPRFFISPDGAFERVVGMDEMMDAVLAMKGASEKVAEIVRRPQMQAQLQAVAGYIWLTWVEAWAGLVLRPAELVKGEQLISVFSTSIPADFVVEHLGTLESAPQLRLLHTRSVVDGEEATEAMRRVARGLSEQVEGPPGDENAIESVRRFDDLWVAIDYIEADGRVLIAIDPDGAFPHHVRRETVIEVNDQRREDVQAWEFDWSKAVGCR